MFKKNQCSRYSLRACLKNLYLQNVTKYQTQPRRWCVILNTKNHSWYLEMPRVARKNRREVCSMTNKELYVLFIMDNVRLGVPWRSRLRRRGILSAAARILGLHVYFLIKSLYFFRWLFKNISWYTHVYFISFIF